MSQIDSGLNTFEENPPERQTETRRSRISDAEALEAAKAALPKLGDAPVEERPRDTAGRFAPRQPERPPQEADPDVYDDTEAVTAAPDPGLATLNRLEAAARKAGVTAQDYVESLERFAAQPVPEPTVEEEASALLSQNPYYVQLWQRAQDPDNFVSESDMLQAQVSLQAASQAARAQVISDRSARREAERERREAERDGVDRLAQDPAFARHLSTAADRQALRDYAREHKLQDLTVAARAFLYDKAQEGEYKRGKTTAARARQAAVDPGTSAPATSRDEVPAEAYKGGLLGFKRYLDKHKLI